MMCMRFGRLRSSGVYETLVSKDDVYEALTYTVGVYETLKSASEVYEALTCTFHVYTVRVNEALVSTVREYGWLA